MVIARTARRLAAAVSAEMIAAALAAINQRHGALRLRFEQTEGGWQQRYSGLDGIVLARETLPAAADARQLVAFRV